MQEVKNQIEYLKSQKKTFSHQDLVNIVRETLQVLCLKFIFQSEHGRCLSFMGGTCLRICYDLKRYSEDLDFSLDQPSQRYAFVDLCHHIEKEFQLRNYKLSLNIHDEKVVQKSYLRFDKLLYLLGLSPDQFQKLHIKIEVDTRPPYIDLQKQESYFVNRYGEIFPILKHVLPTLFASKILALLFRPYARGRDYYDLIWYLNKKSALDMDYLNAGTLQHASQQGALESKKVFESDESVISALKEKINTINPPIILKDIAPFLEDPTDRIWVKNYLTVFEQISQQWLSAQKK